MLHTIFQAFQARGSQRVSELLSGDILKFTKGYNSIKMEVEL